MMKNIKSKKVSICIDNLIGKSKHHPETKFIIGDLVDVQSRTQPGFNCLGGVGQVSDVSVDAGVPLYSVKYSHGGVETKLTEDIMVKYHASIIRSSRSATNENENLSASEGI